VAEDYMQKVKPLPGFLWCEEVPDYVERDIKGLGRVRVAEERSGLYIPPESKEANPLKGRLLVVRSVGKPPTRWNQRWFRRERDWKTSFEDQRIQVGSLLVVRKVAGHALGADSPWLQVRHDEVCAIGVPFDEEYPMDMRPAPGWVGVQLDQLPTEQREGGLWVRAGIRQVQEDGQGTWATVVALPRGFDESTEGLSMGDRVLIPSHEGAGATELVDFGQGLRFLPFEDVLAIEGSL
jgi:hypothetical protein